MSKKQGFIFIVVVTLVHFGLMLAIIASRLNCGILPHCVSKFNSMAGVALAFPMNAFVYVIYPHGVNFGRWYLIFMFVNSLLAAGLILFLFNRTLLGLKNRAR